MESPLLDTCLFVYKNGGQLANWENHLEHLYNLWKSYIGKGALPKWEDAKKKRASELFENRWRRKPTFTDRTKKKKHYRKRKMAEWSRRMQKAILLNQPNKKRKLNAKKKNKKTET